MNEDCDCQPFYDAMFYQSSFLYNRIESENSLTYAIKRVLTSGTAALRRFLSNVLDQIPLDARIFHVIERAVGNRKPAPAQIGRPEKVNT